MLDFSKVCTINVIVKVNVTSIAICKKYERTKGWYEAA